MFSTTELSQLLKLPSLITHFKEHKELNKDITLLQFLYIHYAQGDVRDADYDKDMKLPFKTHDNCSVQISVAIPPTFLVSGNKSAYTNTANCKYILTNESVTSSYLSSIWQPPKSC